MTSQKWQLAGWLFAAVLTLIGLGFAAMSVNVPFHVAGWVPLVFFVSAGILLLCLTGWILWPVLKRTTSGLPHPAFSSSWLREAVKKDIENLPSRVCLGNPEWDFAIDSTEAFVEVKIPIRNRAVFPFQVVGFSGSFTIGDARCLEPAVLQNTTRLIEHLDRTVFIVKQPITGETAKKVREHADIRQKLPINLGACYIEIASRQFKHRINAHVGLGNIQTEIELTDLSSEAMAEMVLFIKDLQAVAKRLHSNISGSVDCSVSAALSYIRAQTQDQLTKLILPGQAAELMATEYGALESDTRGFAATVDALTPSVSLARQNEICSRLRVLVTEYYDSVSQLQRFLEGMQLAGIQSVWDTDSWRKVIYPTLIRDHNILTELVRGLMKDAPKSLRSSLPLEHSLKTI